MEKMAIALGLVLHGVWLLRRVGREGAHRDDSVLLPFEKTTALVMVGAYRFIRHPLHSSLLFVAWEYSSSGLAGSAWPWLWLLRDFW